VEATYVRIERFDPNSSTPLPGESAAEHRAFCTAFRQLHMSDLHGFPLWEKEMHDVLHVHFLELTQIFHGYCASFRGEGGSARDDAARDATMGTEELYDFVVDVGLESALSASAAASPTGYSFERVLEQMERCQPPSRSGGRRGLQLHEFVSLLLRVCFFRLNPGAMQARRTLSVVTHVPPKPNHGQRLASMLCAHAAKRTPPLSAQVLPVIYRKRSRARRDLLPSALSAP
jgi:hypothetical protein